ncbi:MAG: hypothetical protein HN742_35635, partial [Lentisphaerae bacterium]|nr:hypothetical protein [Lentisphaerota bacterium]MBT7059026.1 hypothetical protein [Lentisphaerota bacterium]MBT7847257.1 hypothetical protein [Lentisphaerota bacterium]
MANPHNCPLSWALAAAFALAVTGQAADLITPLDAPPDVYGRYVPVDLSGVANDTRKAVADKEWIEINRVPFRLVNGQSANALFLKPIGWSAEHDESGEYRGYIAKYDRKPEQEDPTRAVVQIPVADYVNVWLLAAADDDASLTQDLTLRFGQFGGPGRTAYHDVVAIIPRTGAKKVRRGQNGVERVIPREETGNLYLVRIAVNMALAQDFRDHWLMDLDITKKLAIAVRQPDPHRFQLRPIGDPSGVRIHAMTLDRSSLEMDVTGGEPGNVFNQPQKPWFDVTFTNHYEHYREHRLEADVRRDDGQETHLVFPNFRPWHPRHRTARTRQKVELDITGRGQYELTLSLLKRGKLLLRHKTTFAILAPDTRKHRTEGPFGAWDFGGGHTTPSDLDVTGPLAVKAGWRYMRKSEKYGLEAFNEPNLHREKSLEALLKKKREDPDFDTPERLLLFHETAISGPHVTRTPDVFTGKTYTLTESDQKRFDELWEQAHTGYEVAQREFPDAQVYFGNGAPQLIEEFCRRGISKDLLKIAGNECGSFMRPPETQPTDFVANNAGLWMFRRILDHYGYTDTKVWQCYEITYPNTNPGNLTYETQAAYYVRHIMHSLAWRVPKITVGAVTDMGNSYYHSNWGGSGFCFAYPDVSPKRSYVAYAVLTQVLDGARFQRVIPQESPVVYGLEFRASRRRWVTCLWTLRGTRRIQAESSVREGTLTGMYGRETAVAFRRGKADIEISTAPVYLQTTRQVKRLVPGQATYAPPPAGETFTISELGRAADWTMESGPDTELDVYNFATPRRKGDFELLEVSALEGREQALRVRPRAPAPGPEFLQMYTALKLNEPVEIPGKPTELGLWVHGNGGWGRIIFELEDASGQRWISIGAEMGGKPNPWMADWMPKEEFEKLERAGKAGISDWNSNDAWGRSFINHEGWRYVRFPLPGRYGANNDGYHWPYA